MSAGDTGHKVSWCDSGAGRDQEGPPSRVCREGTTAFLRIRVPPLSPLLVNTMQDHHLAFAHLTFLIMALLRYNSHTVRLTQVEYVVKNFPVCSEFAMITTLRCFRHSQKKLCAWPHPLPSVPGSQLISYCLYRLACSGHFT